MDACGFGHNSPTVTSHFTLKNILKKGDKGIFLGAGQEHGLLSVQRHSLPLPHLSPLPQQAENPRLSAPQPSSPQGCRICCLERSPPSRAVFSGHDCACKLCPRSCSHTTRDRVGTANRPRPESQKMKTTPVTRATGHRLNPGRAQLNCWILLLVKPLSTTQSIRTKSFPSICITPPPK